MVGSGAVSNQVADVTEAEVIINYLKSDHLQRYWLIIVLLWNKSLLDLKTSKCWVWFKGTLNKGGYWKEGFTCTFDEKPGVLIESPAYVACRVPNWRILTKEPENLFESPQIPDKAIWKII